MPQLLHILQLKGAITQQHRTLLHAAIANKRRRNEQVIEQQRLELAARQQRKQFAMNSAHTAASDNMTDVQPSAAASAETAAAHPANTTSTSAINPPLLASSLPLPSLADLATLTFPTPPTAFCSESQLLTLLPSIVAVHLLHCGFSSFPRSALSVLSEATADFIRRAGVALRVSEDNSSAARRRKRSVSGGEKADRGVAGTNWLTSRLLRSLGVSDVRSVQRFYQRAIVRAGERIRATEERLLTVDSELRRQQPDTVLKLNHTSSVSGRRWLCEPFSPLRSFVQSPAIPNTPPPLEDETVEEQPPQSATHTADTSSSSGAMAVDGTASEVDLSGQSSEIGAIGAAEQSTSAERSLDVQTTRELASATSSAVEEQAAAALPPLENVDGLLNSEPAQTMLE